MDDSIKLEIFGTAEMANFFTELGTINQNKIIKSGFRKSAKIILNEAKSNLNSGKKNNQFNRIEKKFKIVDVDKSDKLQGVNIGNTSYLSRWLESGTKSRNTKGKQRGFRKSVKPHSTGKIIGIHFLEKATLDKGEEAINSLYENISKALKIMIKKYSR